MSDLRAPLSNKEELPELLRKYREAVRGYFDSWLDREDAIRTATAAIESHLAALESENERLKETALTADAERWRALIGSARVEILGGARFHKPGWLLGVQFYDEYPSGIAKAEAIEVLTQFADYRRRVASSLKSGDSQ
jgi:hypothetical protein